MRGAALIGKSVYTENGVFEQPGGEPVDGYLQLNEVPTMWFSMLWTRAPAN